MFERLLNFIKKPTTRNVIINTVGNYINVGFTAFFALLLVRALDPSDYGVLSVLLGIAYVLANVLDFGTTATIYSYLPNLHQKRASNLYVFIKSTFFFQSLFSIIVIAALFISFPFLDQVFFKTRAPSWELYLTSVSVLFFIWQNFILNLFFATKQFFKANLYLNLSNFIKTLIILMLMAQRSVSVGAVIFIFGIVGPLIFFTLILLDKRTAVLTVMRSPVRREEFRFGYTLTYFVASQFFNLGMRTDLFLLSFFGLRNEVGYYGLSQKIILSIISTVGSITQVLSPGFSHYNKISEIRHHFKIGFLYLLIPSGLFLLLIVLPGSVFTTVFTQKFAPTTDITRALAIPFIIYSIGNLPMLFVLYTVKKPKYILVGNLLFFVILTALCFYLIPIYGVFGPPIALGLGLAADIGLLSVVTIREYRKLVASPQPT